MKFKQFLQALIQMPVEKKLWIVEVGRIRIHLSGAENDGNGFRTQRNRGDFCHQPKTAKRPKRIYGMHDQKNSRSPEELRQR